MGVLQTELENELGHSNLMLEGVKYLQLIMTATECELSAPLRNRPWGQAGDFLSSTLRLEKQSKVMEMGRGCWCPDCFLGPCAQTNILGVMRAPESTPQSNGTQHFLTSGMVASLCPSTSEKPMWALNAPSVLCKVATWPLPSPQLGWKLWTLQRNMLRQAQPGWPHVKSILVWKQIKS